MAAFLLAERYLARRRIVTDLKMISALDRRTLLVGIAATAVVPGLTSAAAQTGNEAAPKV